MYIYSVWATLTVDLCDIKAGGFVCVYVYMYVCVYACVCVYVFMYVNLYMDNNYSISTLPRFFCRLHTRF
jgi:hypothetical protein